MYAVLQHKAANDMRKHVRYLFFGSGEVVLEAGSSYMSCIFSPTLIDSTMVPMARAHSVVGSKCRLSFGSTKERVE